MRTRLRFSTALALTVVVVVCNGCKKKEAPPAPSREPPPSSATTPKEAALPAKPTCAAPDAAKIAPFVCDRAALDVAVPPIVDPKNVLAPLHDRLLELARGTAKRDVRIAVYGDSNLTADALSGHLRRQLQARYGDAGHGFVALARPWAWYSHNDVHHSGTWPLFRQIAVTTDVIGDKQYGFANIAAESAQAGAAAWVVTTKTEGSPIGKTVKSFDVFFLKQPRGGTFRVDVDGAEVKSVSTRANAFEAGFERIDVETDAVHEMKCVVKGDGPVRFYGAALERPVVGHGIQVDGLGCGSLNYQRLTMVANDTRRVQLAHRRYDAIIIWLGTNVMWLEPNKGWAKEAIAEMRAALPGVPILIMTPPDSVKDGETKSDPRIVTLVKQLKEIVEENETALWDLRAAMGGDASMLVFQRKGYAGADRVHLSKYANEVMADRFLCAFSAGLGARLAERPQAGCEAAP